MRHRLLARLLRPFTKVHPDEAAMVVVMTVAAFLLLSSYHLLKTVREPLILLHGGAELKLYARAGQALLMVGVVHVYGQLAQRIGRMRLLALGRDGGCAEHADVGARDARLAGVGHHAVCSGVRVGISSAIRRANVRTSSCGKSSAPVKVAVEVGTQPVRRRTRSIERARAAGSPWRSTA